MDANKSLVRHLLDCFLLLLAVFSIGVFGFWALGDPQPTWLDAALMAVITISTVGFGEVVALNTTAIKVFCMVYMLAGMATLWYVVFVVAVAVFRSQVTE